MKTAAQEDVRHASFIFKKHHARPSLSAAAVQVLPGKTIEESSEGKLFILSQPEREAFLIIYSKITFASRHALRISSGQTEACTSPTCTLPRSSMQSLDCPIPPPIVYGSSPARSAL